MDSYIKNTGLPKKLVLLTLIVGICLSLVACAKKCETCEATGEVTCTACEGTGETNCTHCNDGLTTCSNCGGKKQLECKDCKGNGRVKSATKCAACKDSKKPGYEYDKAQALKDLFNGTAKSANDSKYWIKCKSCDGVGYKMEKCGTCSGTGLNEECNVCSGSGKTTCTVCNGSMVITCKTCSGTTKVTCKTCNGAGEIK